MRVLGAQILHPAKKEFAAQCVFQEWRWAEVTDAVVQSRAFVSLDLSLRFGPDCRRRPPVLKIAREKFEVSASLLYDARCCRSFWRLTASENLAC